MQTTHVIAKVRQRMVMMWYGEGDQEGYWWETQHTLSLIVMVQKLNFPALPEASYSELIILYIQ